MYYFSKDEDEENLAYEQHKKYIDKLFYNCIDGKSEKLYIKILERPEITDDSNKEQSNEEGSSNIVQISLVTQEMLEYDIKVFKNLENGGTQLDKSESNNTGGMIIESEKGGILYRPYFLEFIVNIDKVEKKDRVILTDKNIVGKWIEASLVTNYLINEGMYVFPGVVLYSASPFVTEHRQLIIQDKNIKKIPDNINKLVRDDYNTSKSVKGISEIQNILKKQFDSASDYKVRIYNVGDGNCIYIYGDNGSRVLFDIGHNYNPFSSDWKEPKIQKTEFAISNMKPYTTILSHWDLDHVIGVVFAKHWIFKQPWIAPDLNVLPQKQVSLGALRLAKYLELYNQLYLVDISYRNKKIYSESTINIWCGKGNIRGKRLTETNNAGLIIQLIKGEAMTLLTGDCEYLALPDDLEFSKNRFHNLVIPHHCSKMDTSLINCTTLIADNAIISVSIRNSKRPDCVHKDYLKNVCGYSVYETGNYFCIEIPSITRININPCN